MRVRCGKYTNLGMQTSETKKGSRNFGVALLYH
jgi:hypothetical protein